MGPITEFLPGLAFGSAVVDGGAGLFADVPGSFGDPVGQAFGSLAE